MYSVLELGANLGGEIGRRPLDALAEDEAHKSGHPDRRAEFLGGRFDDLADASFAVDHEDLLEENDLLVEFAQPAFDHALDDRLCLGARLRLLAEHRALAVERRRRHLGGVDVERLGGRDVHRQLSPQSGQRIALGFGFERDQHGDLAETRRQGIMDIGGNDSAPDLETCRAAEHKVFADSRDQLGQFAGHRAAGSGIGRLFQRFDIAARPECEPADGAHEGLEQLVARDEIGLGIDFDRGPGAAPRGDPDKPFGSDPPGLLRGGGETLFAQPVDSALDVAAGVAERALAIHHPGAGLVAQFLDQRRGHLGHSLILSNTWPAAYSPGCAVSASEAADDAATFASASAGSVSAAAVRLSSSTGSSSGSPSAGSTARAPISTPEAANSACSPSSTALA